MDLNKVKYFQVVARQKSISKAARLVHLSQPALSLMMQNLEYELNVKLFERHNRGLILTPQGEKLLVRANSLLDWERETQEMIEDFKRPSGQLRVGTYTTASSYLLSPALNEFFDNYPDIQISYDYSTTDQVLEKINRLELDCAIISEVPDHKGLEKIDFFENRLVLVANHNFKIPRKLTPRNLPDYPFLSYPLRLDYCYQQIERKYGKYINKMRKPIESESFETLKQSLLAGIGITFMPEYLIASELKNKQLKIIELGTLKLPITFSLVLKKNRKLPGKLAAFRDFILGYF